MIPVCSASIGMKETRTEESKKAKEIGLLFFAASANFPPTHPPTARPSNVSPITDVHVKTEDPMIGATILEEISSITMIQKPTRKELTM